MFIMMHDNLTVIINDYDTEVLDDIIPYND